MESEESAQPLGKPICLTCPYCQHIYTDQSRRHYEMHVRLCQTEKPYNCSICGTGFSNQNTLRRHQKLHTGGSTEECSVCGKVVSTKFVLKKHMAIHEPREMREKTRYKCSQCDKSFLFKPSLNKHYKIHTGNAVYKCEGCLLTFSSYSKKYHHCRNCAKYICKKTDKSEQFTENSDSLISTVRHKVFSKTNCQKESKNVDEKMLPQKDKPFNCDDCGAQYSSHITLKRHQKQHSGTTGEACPVCGKVLSTKFVMKQHMAVHEPAATREKTRFQCSQCDKSFLFKPSLSRHLKTHTDDASCQCAGCKLVFDSYSSLYRHSKNCEKYIAGISRSSNRCKYSPDIRNVHENSPDENTNDTERGNLRNDTNNHILHKCQICEKSFSIRNMLSKHVDTVHDVFAMQNDTDLEFTEACVAGELLADNEKLSTPEKSNANGEVVSPVSDENILEIRGKLHTQSHAIPIRVVQKEKNKDRQLITLADETENGKQSVGTKNKSEVKLNIDKDIMKCAQSIKQESMLNTVDTTGNSEIFHCRKSKRRIKVKAEKDYHYDLPYIRRVIENHIEAGPGNDSTNLGQDEEYQPEMEIAFLSERPVDEHCKKRNYLSERSSLAVSIEIGQSIKTVDTTGKNEHNENNKNKKYIQLHKKKIFRKNVQKEKILTKSVENKSKNKEKQNRNENKINTSSSVNNNSSEFEYTKMEPGSETHIDSTLINNMVICRYCTFSGDSIHGLKDHLRVAHKELETNDEVQKDYAVVNEIGHVNQYLYPCKVCFEFLPNLDDLIKHNAEIHCESSETSRANSGCRKKHVTEMRSVSEEVNSVHTPINKEVKKEGKKKTNKGVKKKKNKAESSAAASDEGMRIEGSKDVSVQYRCTAPGCKCTTQFKWKKTLERHKQEEHHEKLLHVCGICDSQYAEAHVYKSHLRLAHSETQYVQLKLLDTLILENETIDGTEKSTKRFHVDVCTACGETFVSTKPGSYQHECIPKDIRYYCPYCKHIGDDFSAVKEHISELHPDLQKTKENGGQYQNLEFQHVIPETRSKTFQSDSESVAGVMEADVARESMCKTCGRIFSTSQEMQSHAVAHTGIRPFVCGLCGYSYTRRPALTTHMLHHQGKGFRCRHCCMKFAVKSLRDVHEQTHTGERPHTCHICDNRYSNEKSLKIHVSMKHKSLRKNIQGSSKSDSGQCQLCGMVFQNGRLQQHLQKKHPETVCCKNIPCKYCSEKFFNSKQLKRHISVCHSDHRQLYGACMEENSGKIDYSSYVISDANISSSKQLICALCNQKFLRMKDIHSHLRRVHRSDTDKEFFCSICNRGFSLAREMQVHMRSHTNSRPYICRVCGKTYKQVGHVRQHLLSHSNSCISCRICGKLFKTDVCLSYHVRNHNRLHPYKCPICAESFKEIAKLLSHCSQYSDQDQNKTYTCHMCLKAFESAVIVCKHLVSHKADCPYVCEKCPESFSQYSQLYKHKVDADHFTENEIISSTISNNRVLTSCNSVDMDMHELIKQYDYVPADNMELDPALLRGEKQRKKSKNPRQQKPKTSPEDSAPVVEPIVTVKYEADMEDKSSQEEILIAVAQQLTDMGEAGEPGHIDTFTDTTDQTNILVTHAFTTNSEFVNPVSHEINVEQCVVWDTEVVTSAGDLECHEFDTDLQPSTSCDNASVELGNLTSSLIYKAKQQDCSEPVTCMDSDTVTMTYPDNTADSSSVLRPTHKVIDASGNELFVCFVNENNTPDDDIDEETINKLFQNEDFFVQSAQNLIIADDHREDVVEDAVVSTCDPDLSNHVNMKVPYSVENNSMEVHEDGVFVNDSAIVAGDIEANKTDINVEQLNGMNYKINGRYYNREQTKLTHPFQCPECPKRFKLPSALTLHSSCHLQDADCKHKCGFCGKGFSTPSRLKLHENIHLGLRPYKCKQCPKSFRQPGHLMTHLRIHANYRPFQCSMCSVSYTSQAHLNQHLQRHKFLDQRTQHKCRICHKVYVLKKSLDQHYLTVHGETNELNQELTDSNQPDIQGEKYRENLGSRMCDMCGKSYNTTRDFENHLLTHNGQAENDEMVKCARCSKLFASPELLIQHMQCHAKANYKYQCEICGQSLSSKQGVLRHIQRCHGKI